jgi:hypothetical protein
MKTQFKTLLLVIAIFCGLSLHAQDEGEQSRESMAVDATASQWSFQFAYQWMPDYYDDILSDGSTRPAGMDDYAQLRVVAPISMKKLTILPRLTIRHYEAPSGKSGFGNTELFGLIIPKATDWGTGRAGIGPWFCSCSSAKYWKLVLRITVHTNIQIY